MAPLESNGNQIIWRLSFPRLPKGNRPRSYLIVIMTIIICAIILALSGCGTAVCSRPHFDQPTDVDPHAPAMEETAAPKETEEK